MKLHEVDDLGTADPQRLVALVQFLRGRAKDTASKSQISKQSFMALARNLGIIITSDNLDQLANQPPLNNILEPVDPSSEVLVFKGGESSGVNMPVNKAQDIVAKMANKANTLS